MRFGSTLNHRPVAANAAYCLQACPICGGEGFRHLFTSYGSPIVKCDICRLVLRNPQPDDDVLAETYGEHYFLGGSTPHERAITSGLKQATARLYLDKIEQYQAPGERRLLDVGCGQGDFLVQAKARGYVAVGMEISAHAAALAQSKIGNEPILCGGIEDIGLLVSPFDICVMIDVLEHTRHPKRVLELLHTALRPGGLLFIITPDLYSWSGYLLKRKWVEFKTEHLFYFSRPTIQKLLFATGYCDVSIASNKKALNIDYIYHHFKRFPSLGLRFIFSLAHRILPTMVRARQLVVNCGGMMVVARKRNVSRRPKLSVIVPAYNENRTVGKLMYELINKEIDGLDIDIVIVESNSTDGTREQLLRYVDHPRVKLVLEDKPYGKGHAVRAAFQHITGDFVLIQDADLEYDVADYDVLVEPLRTFRETVVLGSRHDGISSWTMRGFTDRRLLGIYFSLGHILFTALFNVLYWQKLKDPFTMYKVFRRDCITDLHFECNGFDFDLELLIKLIRRGYRPTEVPITYHSRSFAEGKKVSLFRDPLTWIRALIKYRFARLCDRS